jgi:hypothetical protein
MGETLAAILMLLNRLLDAAVPPVGGPQNEIDSKFNSIVEALRAEGT